LFLVKFSAAFKKKRMFSLAGRWVSANGEILPLFLQLSATAAQSNPEC
jgi:hypothetical protein